MDFSLSEEHLALRDTARRFTKERIIPVAAACDRDATFPHDVFKAAWEIGLVNPCVPEEFGGAGMGEFENALMTEEMAYGCAGIQTSITANQLALTPIKLGGTDGQKKKYLGMLTAEPIMASYATSEPDAGSDVAAIKTRFTQHGDDYVLNGAKCWITNASYARFYVIFATIDPALKHRGMAAFIVDRDTPGLRVGKKEDKLGQRASDTAVIHLDDVKVPKENLLAAPGQGFKLAMETFNQTRPDIAAGATGLMRRCLEECVAYAKERKTFGVPIYQHQLVAALIAEMAIRAEGTRLLYQKAAWQLDQGIRDPQLSAIGKAYGADSAMQTAVDAVQVFGGNGFTKEYPVEKLMRDAKVLQIYEGTSQIQRIVIAKSLFALAVKIVAKSVDASLRSTAWFVAFALPSSRSLLSPPVPRGPKLRCPPPGSAGPAAPYRGDEAVRAARRAGEGRDRAALPAADRHQEAPLGPPGAGAWPVRSPPGVGARAVLGSGEAAGAARVAVAAESLARPVRGATRDSAAPGPRARRVVSPVQGAAHRAERAAAPVPAGRRRRGREGTQARQARARQARGKRARARQARGKQERGKQERGKQERGRQATAVRRAGEALPGARPVHRVPRGWQAPRARVAPWCGRRSSQ